MNTLDDIISVFDNYRDTGMRKITEDELDKAVMEAAYVFRQIRKYTSKHPMALACPDDYIYQDDDAQTDAIELVLNICEQMTDYSEYED